MIKGWISEPFFANCVKARKIHAWLLESDAKLSQGGVVLIDG